MNINDSKQKEYILAENNGVAFYVKYIPVLEARPQLECKITTFGLKINDGRDSSGKDFPKTAFDTIEIPSSIDGYKVTKFGVGYGSEKILDKHGETLHRSTYLGRYCVNKLILPDCIKYISESTFRSSEHIKSVVWPKSVNKIPPMCFYYSTVERIFISGEIESVSDFAFNGSSLKFLTVPDGCTVIGKGAFGNCKDLEEVNLPNTIESILNGAFSYSSKLDRIIWPKSCHKIPAECFIECNSLEEITFSGDINEICEKSFFKTKVMVLDLARSLGNCIIEPDAVNLNCSVIPPFYGSIL